MEPPHLPAQHRQGARRRAAWGEGQMLPALGRSRRPRGGAGRGAGRRSRAGRARAALDGGRVRRGWARPCLPHPSSPAGRCAAPPRNRAGGGGVRPVAARHRRRALSSPLAADAAGCRDGDPREDDDRRPRLPPSAPRRPSPPAAGGDGAPLPRPSARAGGGGGGGRALRLLAARPDLSISRRDRHPRQDRAGGAGDAGVERPEASFRRKPVRSAPRTARPRVEAGRENGLRALFPDGQFDRPICAQPGHRLPGARQRGQFGDLLRARHHLDRSGQTSIIVRAFRLRGTPRAARYRRRFRA